MTFLSTLLLSSLLLGISHVGVRSDPIALTIPSTPTNTHVVSPNFFGISFELSYIDVYFGNSTSTIPPALLSYLSLLRARTPSSLPLRLRLGGNSMDNSTYVPSQTTPMINLTDPTANVNNQPVDFGPGLWDVMKGVAQGLGAGGAGYLVGLDLQNVNSTDMPLMAGSAEQALGNYLDAFLLGNEPDLYASHGDRPGLANYTVQNYISDFQTASSHLQNTSAGNILSLSNIAGPTICCNWDLATLIQQGWLDAFHNELKYVTLQHYPQNNCFGGYQFGMDVYLQHSSTVALASWQLPGLALSSKPILMSEFNTASCGGVPGISDTFGAGTLWIIDYALQLASVGYSGAYVHTREPNISYNIFNPGPKEWTTGPPFYALMVVAEALNGGSGNGSGGVVVEDLDVGGGSGDKGVSVAGYAVYDAGEGGSLNRLVLVNFANTSSTPATFALPASIFNSSSSASKNVTFKFLVAPSNLEKTNISYGGQTFAGVGDGKPVASGGGEAQAGVEQTSCEEGCSVSVPSPGLVVVFVGGGNGTGISGEPASQGGTPSSGKNGGGGGVRVGGLGVVGAVVGALVLGMLV
ncbi:glycoside hydrolase family 79 protein [Jaapia argillacea MUCL 33604]|uniref:Glycoside hydrolase family 79 protein n=1 Tax=Jaapia argillacea MUCL 33604 TaxID=933084 RepID=A0A067QBF4_9AGAM|nr:glycoside hydrolase family 79 protein [Jaapia argillacea MUCL 33604]